VSDLGRAEPPTLVDIAWQIVFRLGFPVARIWWRLQRRRHVGALVAIHVEIVLEFYRIRKADDAVVGRETADAADLDDAIGLARQLRRTLDMPQRPDAMSISDNEGNRLYSGTLDTAKNTG
jgi:hypothetical protein